jgi:hypothetical protein
MAVNGPRRTLCAHLWRWRGVAGMNGCGQVLTHPLRSFEEKEGDIGCDQVWVGPDRHWWVHTTLHTCLLRRRMVVGVNRCGGWEWSVDEPRQTLHPCLEKQRVPMSVNRPRWTLHTCLERQRVVVGTKECGQVQTNLPRSHCEAVKGGG